MKRLIVLIFILFLSSNAVLANPEYRFQLHRMKRDKAAALRPINQELRALKLQKQALTLDTSQSPQYIYPQIKKCRERIEYLEKKKDAIEFQFEIDKAKLKERCK